MVSSNIFTILVSDRPTILQRFKAKTTQNFEPFILGMQFCDLKK